MVKPESIVQKQLDAYHAHDLELFLSAYSQTESFPAISSLIMKKFMDD
jgi:hypothetical protein